MSPRSAVWTSLPRRRRSSPFHRSVPGSGECPSNLDTNEAGCVNPSSLSHRGDVVVEVEEVVGVPGQPALTLVEHGIGHCAVGRPAGQPASNRRVREDQRIATMASTVIPNNRTAGQDAAWARRCAPSASPSPPVSQHPGRENRDTSAAKSSQTADRRITHSLWTAAERPPGMAEPTRRPAAREMRGGTRTGKRPGAS